MPPPHFKRCAQAPPANSKQHVTTGHPGDAQASHTGVKAWTAAAAAAPTPAVSTPTYQQKTGMAHSTNLPLNRNLVNQGGAAAGVNSGATTAMPGNLAAALRILGQRGVDKIQCHICKTFHDLSNYSHRQLINYKDSIYNEYAPSGRCKNKTASCKNCTVGVVTHLDCIVCELTKPLSKFMKTQRRNPDSARCKRCVQHHMETDRLGEVVDLDEYEGDDSTDDDSDYDVDAPTRQFSWGTEDDNDVDSTLATALENVNLAVLPKPCSVTLTCGTATGSQTPLLCVGGSATPSSMASGRASSPSSSTTTSSSEWKVVNTASKMANYAYKPSAALEYTPSGYGTLESTNTTTPACDTRKKGGFGPRPRKPPPEEALALELLWTTREATANNWSEHGGQPRLFKRKTPKVRVQEQSEDEVEY